MDGLQYKFNYFSNLKKQKIMKKLMMITGALLVVLQPLFSGYVFGRLHLFYYDDVTDQSGIVIAGFVPMIGTLLNFVFVLKLSRSKGRQLYDLLWIYSIVTILATVYLRYTFDAQLWWWETVTYNLNVDLPVLVLGWVAAFTWHKLSLKSDIKHLLSDENFLENQA